MGSNVPEHVKARWRGIKAYNKTRKRRMQKRHKRVAELWLSGQFSRREIALLTGVAYITTCRDIKAVEAALEAHGTNNMMLDRRVRERSAAEHRRLADLLDGGVETPSENVGGSESEDG